MTMQGFASKRLNLAGSSFFNNSQTGANTADGLQLSSDSASFIISDINLRGASFYDDQPTPTQRYGFTNGANCDQMVLESSFYGNITAPYISSATNSTISVNGAEVGTDSPTFYVVNYGNNVSAVKTTSTPTVYGTASTGAAYPFLEAGNLVIQSRGDAARDIVFITGTARAIAARFDRNQNTILAGYLAKPVGAVVASAATITPTGPIFHVSGTATVNTINLPFAGFTGSITIIPDGAFSTGTSGNIALATAAVVNKSLVLTFDGTKWYPSY